MKAITKSKFQVVYLYASTLMGSLLGFVTSIVNTRFLTEAEYGDVRYVQNLITLFASLLLFGYFLSGSRLLAISGTKEYSRRIRGAMVVVLVVCAAILLAMTALAGVFHFGEENVRLLFWVSLPVCFYPLLTNYINTTAQGDNHMGRLAVSRFLPAFLYVPIAYLSYTKYGATPSMMVLLQWGVYSLVLILLVVSTKPSFVGLGPVFKELRSENDRYGKHLYYGSLAMVATNYLAGFTLGIFNDDNVNVGFYTLALTLTAPLAYLPGIIGSAYFKRFVNEAAIPGKVLKGSVLLTVASCICFMLFIRFCVDSFYPESYSAVSSYASWMAIGFSIHGLGDMINRFLGSHGEGKAIRNSSYACGLFKITGFVFLVWLWDINGALITNVISSCIYTLVLFYYYRQSTRPEQ